MGSGNDNEKRVSFEEFKKVASRSSLVRRNLNEDPAFSCNTPQEARIQLTTKCNLRCKHCFQWNKDGYYSGSFLNYLELPFNILENLINHLSDTNPLIYLWGGEPLLYSEWDSLASLVRDRKLKTVISTNGLFIKQKLETLNIISDNLEIVISLDGLKEQHDSLRGNGTFDNTIDSLECLCRHKQNKDFRGKLTINCSIHNELVPKLHEFVKFCKRFDINKLILGFPWYINKNTCIEMDRYYKKHFTWIGNKLSTYSWHSFKYHIDFSLLTLLENEIRKIKETDCSFIIRFHPSITSDLNSILHGEVKDKSYGCIAPSCRIVVWANGDVSFCGDFPEFSIDNLQNKNIISIWNSRKFEKLRKVFNTNPKPLSLCQRCRFNNNNLS